MKLKLSRKEKEKIKKNLKKIIQNKEEVKFAYLHGSFLINGFNDIDLAFLVSEIEDILDEEIRTDFIEKVWHQYLDFKPIEKEILMDMME